MLAYASRASGGGICIYDLKHLIITGSPDSFQRDFRGHYCGFCHMVRSTPEGREACIHSDVVTAVSLGEEYREPFFHTCHVGITELVVPVLYQDSMIAIIFVGQCRLKNETRLEAVVANAAPYSEQPGQLADLFRDLPVIERPQLWAVGMLLHYAIRQLMDHEGKAALELYFNGGSHNHVSEAVRFIEAHYLEGITAGDVVEKLHLNRSYLSRLFKSSVGRSVTGHINWVRVQKAKSLLARTNIPISSIAINVGFMDQNYFTRQFSKLEGCSPGEYRKRSSGHTGN
jgi:AraC-like DNA-binding protein/ligand-binding sensor protein